LSSIAKVALQFEKPSFRYSLAESIPRMNP